MSTPFDNDVVDKLNPLVPLFKVASADITNLPLLKKVAQTKKPVILSTGASDLEEIKFSYNFLKKWSKRNYYTSLYIKLSNKTYRRKS